MTHVVVSVTGPDAESGHAQAREAEAVGADLVEVRLDLFQALEDALSVLKGRSIPAIATCRRAAEGGAFRDVEPARRRALQQAARAGAAYVDLERDVLSWKVGAAKVIGSLHLTEGIPSAADAKGLLAAGASVAKLVGTPGSLRETKALLDMNAAVPGKVMAFGMGSRSLPTRVLAGRSGAWAVYAASDIGAPAAPGQPPVSELLFAHRFRDIGPGTLLYALIGSPIDQSPGSWGHTAAMRAAGINGAYVALDASDEADARFAAHAFGLSGASVTRPFKEAFLDFPDTIEDEARRIGALNTLTWRGELCQGANTDASGLRRLLAAAFRGRTPRVAVVGSGGLARAALAAAPGASVLARRKTALEAPAIRPEDLPGFDAVIQCTPAGGGEDPEGLPFDPRLLRSGAVLVEAHVWPIGTPLTRAARVAGVRVVTGFELWLAQAREQFALWHGREASPELAAAAAAYVACLDARRSVALSGMRGTGKSTVGALVAERLALGFRDLDELISEVAGRPASEVLARDGEEAFRRLETRALARASLGPPGVLALGGGTILRPENRLLLARFARTVLLEAPVHVLRGRLALDPAPRPSLTGRGTSEELDQLWAERQGAYLASAAIRVDANASPEVVAAEVCRHLFEEDRHMLPDTPTDSARPH